jgi:TolB protein
MSNAKLTLLIAAAGCCFGQSVGIFEGHGDVGTALHPGSVVYDAATQSYTVTGSGENIWSTADAFQFAWKRVSGDVTLTANVSFPTKTGDPHKKAVLMIRQSLDAGSTYADAALHGNGLTSLQSRDAEGGATHEIQANITGTRRLRIEKRGDHLYMSVGDDLHFAGGSMKVSLDEPFYVGIGVCAHNKDAEEQAVFSNVEVKETPLEGRRYSTIETISVSSTDRRVTAVVPGLVFSPSWAEDGIFFKKEDGTIARIPVEGGDVRTIKAAGRPLVESYGVSPDGRLVAFGDKTGITVMGVGGGKGRQILKKGTTFQGWTADGKSIVFTRGCTNGAHAMPCTYIVSSGGGKETLMHGGGERDDHPAFSPDRSYLYFDSTRYFDFHYPDSLQIWRTMADGSGLEQLTADSMWNLSPHVSPDGTKVVFLSYEENGELPAGRDVELRMLSVADKKIIVLAKLRGGSGTLGASPWSPDGRRVVLISYQNK